MKLVTFKKDWADEFYVFGWKLFTDQEWDAFIDIINASDGFNMHFGTNEGWEESEDAQDVLEYDMTVKDLSDEEGIVIKAAFGTTEFGVFPDEESFIGYDDDE